MKHLGSSSSPLVKFFAGIGLAGGAAGLSFVMTIGASLVYGPVFYTPGPPGAYDMTLLVTPVWAATVAAGLAVLSTVIPLILREHRLLNGAAESVAGSGRTAMLWNLVAFALVNLAHVAVLIRLQHLPKIPGTI